VKRREPLNLAHVLEDRRISAIPIPIVEKRIHTRFDKAFLVMIGSELYGDSFAVARNLSAGGILVEMSYAPPLGTLVTVHFQHAREGDELDEIVVRAEVKHHHYLNFTDETGGDADGPRQASARAIGLRFLEFLEPNERISPDRIH
jgi:hypothetical protein